MKQVCPVTQWRDETDKGERDREITRWDEETGVIMDSKKGKFVPLCRHGRLRLWRWKEEDPTQTLSAQRKETMGGVGGCSGLPRLCHYSWICEVHTWVLLKPVTLWLIMRWSRVWSCVVIQTQAEFHFHYAPIQCTNRYRPWIWSEIDGAIVHYTTWLQGSFYVDVLIKSSIAASCETHSVMEEHQLSLSTTAFFVSERICRLYLSIMKVNEEFGGSGWSTGQKKQFEDKINHSLYAFRYVIEVSSTLVFPYSNRGPPRHCDFVDLIKSETFVKIISRLINDENNP